MKKQLQINGLISSLLIMVLSLNSCKKGKDGEPGKDGSSNVSSHTFSVTSWTDHSDYWYTQLQISELTSDNINTASVQVYFGTVNNVWRAVPYTYVASTNYFMNYLTTIGMVEVRWEYNGIGSGNSPTSIYSATSQFKVVVIPPAAKKAHPNVDLNNYSEVKKTFDLKD